MKGFVDLVFEYDDKFLFRRLEIELARTGSLVLHRENLARTMVENFYTVATQYLRIAPARYWPAGFRHTITKRTSAARFIFSCAETRMKPRVFHLRPSGQRSKARSDFPWRHLSSVDRPTFGRAAATDRAKPIAELEMAAQLVSRFKRMVISVCRWRDHCGTLVGAGISAVAARTTWIEKLRESGVVGKPGEFRR